MRLKILFVALGLLSLNACRSPAPYYRLCALINNDKDPLYFYCESTNPKEKAYSIWVTDAEKQGYLGMPIDDYRALLKYAKQIEKDLERCRK
jgi:hypothetical protein